MSHVSSDRSHTRARTTAIPTGNRSQYDIPLYELRWPIPFESKGTGQTNDVIVLSSLVIVGAGLAPAHTAEVLLQLGLSVVVDLETLATTVRKDGWASGLGDLDSILRDAKSLGWVEVASRRGGPPASVLRPTEKIAAHPNSLGARYGLGQQPLHTDGAHLVQPPDLVLLSCRQPSSTPTRLWLATNAVPRTPHYALQHGMFLVRNGRDSFYSPAKTSSGYRYDPGCMTPCDARAAEVAQYFERLLSHAAAHEWMREGQVLMIDNRRVLHARSAVAPDDMDRELVRVAFRSEVVQ